MLGRSAANLRTKQNCHQNDLPFKNQTQPNDLIIQKSEFFITIGKNFQFFGIRASGIQMVKVFLF
jgi:hypothetical protein